MNTYLHTNQKCQFLQKWNLFAKSWNAFTKTVSFAHPLNDRPLPRSYCSCLLTGLSPPILPIFFFQQDDMTVGTRQVLAGLFPLVK